MNIDKFRPIPFFFITTDKEEELTYEKAYSSLKKLKEDGFGGFILFNKPPHGFSAEKYLGDEWFSMVRNFLRAAGALSLRVWINDGFNYPPGSVAGKIKEIDGTLSQKRVRLQDGDVVFEDVSWGYPAFELERSSELFIELVYEAYKREVGEYFGNVIEGFFSDADNRRINSGVWNEDSPERDFFPWSDNFAETFEEKYHYDIKPYWNMFKVKELEKAPKWDGHTPQVAIERIAKISTVTRCLHCKRSEATAINGVRYCFKKHKKVRCEDYCSYGERSEKWKIDV
jgi:hypothetical protein